MSSSRRLVLYPPTREAITSRSITRAGSAAPWSWNTTSSRRSTPVALAPTLCQAGKNRATASGGTDSTSWRSAASERISAGTVPLAATALPRPWLA